jgi:hypothetical protein
VLRKARSPEQLATAIESLIASCLDEVLQVAQAALQRSLRRQAVSRRPSKEKRHRSQKTSTLGRPVSGSAHLTKESTPPALSTLSNGTSGDDVKHD